MRTGYGYTSPLGIHDDDTIPAGARLPVVGDFRKNRMLRGRGKYKTKAGAKQAIKAYSLQHPDITYFLTVGRRYRITSGHIPYHCDLIICVAENGDLMDYDQWNVVSNVRSQQV